MHNNISVNRTKHSDSKQDQSKQMWKMHGRLWIKTGKYFNNPLSNILIKLIIFMTILLIIWGKCKLTVSNYVEIILIPKLTNMGKLVMIWIIWVRL